MTIEQFKKADAEFAAFMQEIERRKQEIESMAPLAWALVSNPVFGRAEDVDIIAVFDTLELLEAYYEASKLPERQEVEQGSGRPAITRSFRPDSLLWDYNENAWFTGCTPSERHFIELRPRPHGGIWGQDINIFPHNPTPPSGPIPELTQLDKPQYGYDYGQGPALR